MAAVNHTSNKESFTMKKVLFAALLMLVSALTSTAAMADIIFSSSGTDAAAGTNVNVNQGATGSIYVWVSTEAAQTISGISFNILSSDSTIASGLSHSIQNPGDPARWTTVQAGTVNSNGNLLNNHRAFILPPPLSQNTGLSTSGLSDFVLHSELSFTATNIGTTDLTFTPTSAGISFLGVGGNQWNNVIKGTGSITAVPEPSSALLLTGVACAAAAYRRRRAC
jgi:hypothetical protein